MTPSAPTAIISADAPAPTGPFSHATAWSHLIFTSGQAGRDPESGLMGDPGQQADQALRNIATILRSANSSLEGVLKTTLYIRDDVTDIEAINAAYRRHFPERLPARASVFVSRLKNPDMLIEIEAVAVVG